MVGYQKAIREEPTRVEYIGRFGCCLSGGTFRTTLVPAPGPVPRCRLAFSTSALPGQPGRDPCFLALSILPHVCVAHGRQLTGGLQRRGSRRVPAVEHYLGLLVREQVGCQLGDLSGRKVQRSGQVRVPVVLRVQHFEEDERVPPIHLRPQFVATDVHHHATSSPLQETPLAPLPRPRRRGSRRWWTLRDRTQPDEPSDPLQPVSPVCRSWLCRRRVRAASEAPDDRGSCEIRCTRG